MGGGVGAREKGEGELEKMGEWANEIIEILAVDQLEHAQHDCYHDSMTTNPLDFVVRACVRV